MLDTLPELKECKVYIRKIETPFGRNHWYQIVTGNNTGCHPHDIFGSFDIAEMRARAKAKSINADYIGLI